jgi:hypothetical protein
MATKSDLEKRITELEAEIREYEKAVRILSGKEGMEIMLPQVARDMPTGDAPHLSHQEGLAERLIAILEPALRKHGAKLRFTSPAKSLSLKENIYRTWGDRILVPIVWGEVMAEIIDCAADFGRRCRAEGYREGSDLLGRLMRNEITADEFDESLEKEKAIRRQERKDIANLIQSNA